MIRSNVVFGDNWVEGGCATRVESGDKWSRGGWWCNFEGREKGILAS